MRFQSGEWRSATRFSATFCYLKIRIRAESQKGHLSFAALAAFLSEGLLPKKAGGQEIYVLSDFQSARFSGKTIKLLLQDMANPAFWCLNAAALDAGDGVIELPDDFSSVFHAAWHVDDFIMIDNSADW